MAARSFNISGFTEINRSFDALPKEFSLTRRRTIAKKGMEPFIRSAKQKAPVGEGDLRESIGTKVFRNNPDYVFGGIVTKKSITTVTGKKQTVDGFYAKFIEYGYVQVAWPEKGQTRRKNSFSSSQLKQIEPRPFLTPAYDETKQKVRKATIALVIKRLRAYERKYGKR